MLVVNIVQYKLLDTVYCILLCSILNHEADVYSICQQREMLFFHISPRVSPSTLNRQQTGEALFSTRNPRSGPML